MDIYDRRAEWADVRPMPNDFDKFVPWACNQLSIDAVVMISRSAMSEYVSVGPSERQKSKKKKPKTPISPIEDDSDESDTYRPPVFLPGFETDNIVHIETVYDFSQNLIQLKFSKNRKIPREVMIIIAFVIPYHKYLNSITINRGLQMEVIYEISKCLPVSHITELCLDKTYVPEANYHILLDNEVLKHLSLSQCSINDAVVKTIALKLVDPYPAAKSLVALNLSTNKITDIGAEYLAEALRTNRQLSYLNLADNLINDSGAISIFNILDVFPLTASETMQKKAKFITYLRNKNDVFQRTKEVVKLMDLDKKPSKKRLIKSTAGHIPMKKKVEKDISITTQSRTMVDNVYERVQAIVEGLIEPFDNPFDRNNTTTKDNKICCQGNNTLNYLNIAYNNLSYISVKKLHEVIVTQNLNHRKPGLVNVRIDGNYFPEKCTEFTEIDELLESGLSLHRKLSVSKKRPKSNPSSYKNVS